MENTSRFGIPASTQSESLTVYENTSRDGQQSKSVVVAFTKLPLHIAGGFGDTVTVTLKTYLHEETDASTGVKKYRPVTSWPRAVPTSNTLKSDAIERVDRALKAWPLFQQACEAGYRALVAPPKAAKSAKKAAESTLTFTPPADPAPTA